MADHDDDSDVDSDLDPEDEAEARRARKAIPVENRFEFTPVECPVLDNLKEQFPDSIQQFEKWYEIGCFYVQFPSIASLVYSRYS